jgi:hypothetical protein
MPEMVTAFAMDPLIGSSTLLLFDATELRSVTLSDVPAGIVTSWNAGAGGGAGSGVEGGGAGAAAAGAAAVDWGVAASVTGLDTSGCAGAGDAVCSPVAD